MGSALDDNCGVSLVSTPSGSRFWSRDRVVTSQRPPEALSRANSILP